MYIPARSPREIYRRQRRELIDASPAISQKFSHLKSLTIIAQYFDATGETKNAETKCKLNLAHAKSLLVFACRRGECTGGDYDLSDALAKAVAGRKKAVSGELRCQGTHRQFEQRQVPCQMLLRYKLQLQYD